MSPETPQTALSAEAALSKALHGYLFACKFKPLTTEAHMQAHQNSAEHIAAALHDLGYSVVSEGEARCLHCGVQIRWAAKVRWVAAEGRHVGSWLDDDGVAVAADDHRHTPSSCLGCGRVGTRSTYHEPTGIYLCAERCVPALRSAPAAIAPVGDRMCLHGVDAGEECPECGFGFVEPRR